MIKSELEKILGYELEATENPEFGDYSSNIAMVRAKEEGKNPKKLAEEIVSKLQINKSTNKLIDRIEVAGPGFINFWLKRDVLVSNLTQIVEEKEKYGKITSNKGKKIILEFTDPNPFKEFHIGHLYTNTVGEALSRIFEATGADIKRANYQGDVGLHVAKAVWGLMFKMKDEGVSIQDLEKKDLGDRAKYLGECYALGSRVYEEDASTKEEINTLNKKIFEKDPEILDLYAKGRAWSLEYFETIYKRLGTKFDFYYFESEVSETGKKIVE